MQNKKYTITPIHLVIITILISAFFILPNFFDSPDGEVNSEAQVEDKTEILKAEKLELEKTLEKIEIEKQIKELELKKEQIGLKAPSQAKKTDIRLAKVAKNDDKKWAEVIDKHISETNPNLNNTSCGKANGKIWVEAGKKYGNHPYFLVAIAQADTSLGKGLTNKCNLGNTGHCDSCAKGHQYNSYANSIYSISQTLSNEYLGKGTKSCHFSVGGWKYCPEGKTINSGKFYASSELNWNRNVNATLAKLFGTSYSNDFLIKI